MATSFAPAAAQSSCVSTLDTIAALEAGRVRFSRRARHGRRPRQQRAGLLFGLGAYLLWGVMPLYFKLLAEVAPTEIVAHRIIWSLVFLAVARDPVAALAGDPRRVRDQPGADDAGRSPPC